MTRLRRLLLWSSYTARCTAHYWMDAVRAAGHTRAMVRYHHNVYANGKTARYLVIFDLQWKIIDCQRLEPSTDLRPAMTAAIERLIKEGWQPEGTLDFGFVFINRNGTRRLLILTERDPYDTRPQAFSPFKSLELRRPVCQDQLPMAPKPSNADLRSSPRIACYGTAFLATLPLELTTLDRHFGPEIPQFSSPRLDASFLMNCARLLSGDATPEDSRSPNLKRIAGTDFRRPKSTTFYECSAELCDLLATITEQRAAEMAMKWHAPHAAKVPEANGRTQRRLAILNNLASLARQVKAGHSILMLRVEYRKQR
jgi:hypothetical protein